ncbi:MAG: hypothetical protein ACTHXC_00510 [Brachybacterium sp.]
MNDDKPIEVRKSERKKTPAASWVLLGVLAVTFFGPLAVWLYRLALGI